MLLLIGIIVALVIIGVKFYKSFDADDGSIFKELKEKRNQREISAYGKAGEDYVSKHLNKVIETYGGYLYNGFCFEDSYGYSTEIDHILITRGGVFVIETKTYKGRIIGGEEDNYWTCIKKDYQEDKPLKNPINQNQGHINHLKRMFIKTPPKMESMIVFPVADISNVNSKYVFDMQSALDYIVSKTKQNKYSKEFVEKNRNYLESIKNNHGISLEKHKDNIEQYHQ